MLTKRDIDKILEGYDPEDIEVCTVGSHSALQIMKGARDEGFRNLLLATPKAAEFYRGWKVADEIIEVSSYQDILKPEIQETLVERNAVLVPHGSFVEYIGPEKILNDLKVPLAGSRIVLEWEGDRKKQAEWFDAAGVRMPQVYKTPGEIDRLVMVKFPGAKGGAGYFLAKDADEFERKIESTDLPEDVKAACMIQEYVVGTRFYPHFFYSPLDDSLELLGIDIRYESNIDGLARIPGSVGAAGIEPSYVVTGNIPVVLRESLLPKVTDIARNLVDASKRLFEGGMVGPFCVETTCTQDLEFVCFEVSARIVAGTNVFINGSPYSNILYDEPMSCGRRISRELRKAIDAGRINEVLY